MRNLIYCRVSTDEQDTEMQVSMCKKIAEENNAPTILFIDEAVSSRIPMEEREKLQEFLNEIHEGDLAIVYNVDRIGRDIVECVLIYREIKSLGGKLTSVTDRNCDDEFKMNIKFSMAQEEKRRISERTKHKLKDKQNKFEKVGTVWYGYKLDPNIIQTKEKARTFGKPYKLIPDPYEQEVISTMLRLRHEGISYQGIADYLTQNGIFTREGKVFPKMTVRRILNRELEHPALEEKRFQWSLRAG